MGHAILNALQNAVLEFQKDPWWELTCLVGQVIFGGRFVLQWLVSEHKKKSHVPVAFWYMSQVGNGILLVYFIHIEKPVLIMAAILQIAIYTRNLVLIKKHKGKTAAPAT